MTLSAELGRVLTVNDFYVIPGIRRRGIGRMLVNRLIECSQVMNVDDIDLEVLSGNAVASKFRRSLGFNASDRLLYRLKLG